jgi:hypothetical protein
MNFHSQTNRDKNLLPVRKSFLKNAANASSPLRRRSGTLASAAICISTLLTLRKASVPAIVERGCHGPCRMLTLVFSTGRENCARSGGTFSRIKRRGQSKRGAAARSLQSGQQLKDQAQLDGWLRDGSADYVNTLCAWND